MEIIAVVPHAGTWIEICIITQLIIRKEVVPHAGTWIEINEYTGRKDARFPSFPTRERGLKLIECHLRSGGYFVVPHAGTWIEIRQFPPLLYLVVSFPTRERGLKFCTLRL